MPNYRRAKLYYIRSHLRPDLVYIGATCRELSERFGEHKNTRNGTASKQIIELEDAYIELLEFYPCDSKEELNRREGQLIRSMDCVNKNIPGRPREEGKNQYNKNKRYKSLENSKVKVSQCLVSDPILKNTCIEDLNDDDIDNAIKLLKSVKAINKQRAKLQSEGLL